MTEKTFFLHIDAYKYELPYWMFPWINKATTDAKQADMLLNLRAPNLSDPTHQLDLWIKPESQINFEFLDRLDPEIPERLTSNQRHQLMGITNTYERHGYWLLDLSSDDTEPSFIEWDDPDYR